MTEKYFSFVSAVINTIDNAASSKSVARILVLGTGKSRNSFHPALVASRGKRFFTQIKAVPPLSAVSLRNSKGSAEKLLE